MALVIAGAQVEIPGLDVRSFRDNAKLKLDSRDYRKRPETWVRAIILHTTKGI